TLPIVQKLLKDERVSVNPPIHQLAEEVLVKLISLKLLKNIEPSTKRMCYSCRWRTWDKQQGPNCDRSDMARVGEALGTRVNEYGLLRKLADEDYGSDYKVTYHYSRQRNRHKKPILEMHNQSKNITTNIVVIDSRKDLSFVRALSLEGLGVVAL